MVHGSCSTGISNVMQNLLKESMENPPFKGGHPIYEGRPEIICMEPHSGVDLAYRNIQPLEGNQGNSIRSSSQYLEERLEDGTFEPVECLDEIKEDLQEMQYRLSEIVMEIKLVAMLIGLECAAIDNIFEEQSAHDHQTAEQKETYKSLKEKVENKQIKYRLYVGKLKSLLSMPEYKNYNASAQEKEQPIPDYDL